MRLLIRLVMFGLAGYGAFRLVQDQRPDLLPPALAPAPSPRPAASAAPEKPEPATRKILCATCGGEGKLTYINHRGGVEAYTCPVCSYRGYNQVTPPPGARVCDACRGMGRTATTKPKADARQGHIVDAERCMRCNTTGWILPRAAAD